MARNKELRVDWSKGRFGNVYLRETGEHIATLFRQTGSSNYRYRLVGRESWHSDQHTLEECLRRIVN